MTWKRISNENYEVSDSGLVRNIITKTIIKPFPGGTSPYLCVGLRGNSRTTAKKFLVHRLVAKTFIDNPSKLPEVNHIDGNKLNNNSDNLEWVSAKENMAHAIESGLYSPYNNQHYKNKFGFDHNRSIAILCNNGKIYGSISEASRELNINNSTIQYAVKRGTPMKNGLSFRLINT